jgi:hypothetical protein
LAIAGCGLGGLLPKVISKHWPTTHFCVKRDASGSSDYKLAGAAIRVEARIPLFRISTYLSIGWLIFCAALTAVNWSIIGQDLGANLNEWVALLVGCVLMHALLLWYGVAWLRRRKLAKLNEVIQILNEMDGKSVQ